MLITFLNKSKLLFFFIFQTTCEILIGYPSYIKLLLKFLFRYIILYTSVVTLLITNNLGKSTAAFSINILYLDCKTSKCLCIYQLISDYRQIFHLCILCLMAARFYLPWHMCVGVNDLSVFYSMSTFSFSTSFRVA